MSTPVGKEYYFVIVGRFDNPIFEIEFPPKKDQSVKKNSLDRFYHRFCFI